MNKNNNNHISAVLPPWCLQLWKSWNLLEFVITDGSPDISLI